MDRVPSIADPKTISLELVLGDRRGRLRRRGLVGLGCRVSLLQVSTRLLQ